MKSEKRINTVVLLAKREEVIGPIKGLVILVLSADFAIFIRNFLA